MSRAEKWCWDLREHEPARNVALAILAIGAVVGMIGQRTWGNGSTVWGIRFGFLTVIFLWIGVKCYRERQGQK